MGFAPFNKTPQEPKKFSKIVSKTTVYEIVRKIISKTFFSSFEIVSSKNKVYET